MKNQNYTYTLKDKKNSEFYQKIQKLQDEGINISQLMRKTILDFPLDFKKRVN